MKKRVVLIGGHNKARSLAISLGDQGYSVTAINHDRSHCRMLAKIPHVEVFYGDGTKPFVLENASIYDFDIAIALTSRDDDNLVICELCKKEYNVKKTVAIIGDPNKTSFFYDMGVDSVVCEIAMITSIIEQRAFFDEIATLVPIADGRIKISQVAILDDAPVAGKKLADITLPKSVLIGGIVRGAAGIIPRGDSRILSGDVLVVISSDEHESLAAHVLTGR